MGRRTYDKVLELAAGVYPHKDKKSYVFTQTASGRKREKDQNVKTGEWLFTFTHNLFVNASFMPFSNYSRIVYWYLFCSCQAIEYCPYM